MEELNLIPLFNPKDGLHVREDSPKAPGFRVMENVYVSDRGGIAIRPGTELFGAADTTNGPITTLHTAKRSDGTNIMERTSDNVLEYYNRDTLSWALLKTGYTSGQVFDFKDHVINTDSFSYEYHGNAVEPYERWVMAYDKTTGALAGGETNIPVQSTLLSEVYYSGTATGVTTTTITVSSAPWATDIWNNYYVEITSGAQSGKVSPISATTTTQITFTAITGLAGTPTFRIRRLKFPATGTAIVNSTTISYTQIVDSTNLPVSSAPAAASGSPVASVPEELMSNSCPRGNILAILYQVMHVAGVKNKRSTLYRAKLADPADFRYSSPRIAAEGDVIDFPGDGPIYDVQVFEDGLIIIQESSVFSLKYTQDANDLANREPVVQSPLIGTKGKAFKMGDDIAWATPNKVITSLSRVANKDFRPSSLDIGYPIKTLIKDYDFNSFRGRSHENFSFIAAKETSDSATNDKVLVYDRSISQWVGEWNLPAADFTTYDNNLYFGSSASRETYRMLTTDRYLKKGETVASYPTRVLSNWINKTKGQKFPQVFDTLVIEGYITLGTILTFELFFDFEKQATYSWSFDPTSTNLSDTLLSSTTTGTIGYHELGLEPIGFDLGEEGESEIGERRFYVAYKIKPRVHQFVSLGWGSGTGASNPYYEIMDASANITQLPMQQKYKKAFDLTT
jgi:hypothetical protein